MTNLVKLVAVLTLVALPAVSASASAQTTIEGSTSGTFNAGAASVGGLSFAGTTFGPVQLDGVGDVTSVYLGMLRLDRSRQFNYGGDTFHLLLSFVRPMAGSSVFTAALTGQVNRNANGTPTVHFASAQTLSLGETRLLLDVDGPVNFNHRSTAEEIRGNVTLLASPASTLPPATVTPEPMTMVLLGSGLAGIAAVKRRRRTEDEE